MPEHTTTPEPAPVIGWAILELMGHRKLGGFVTEQEIAGAAFVRIDVPANGTTGDDGIDATQFYAPAAVYCITPTTETMARDVAAERKPRPVERWELPPAHASSTTDDPDDPQVGF